MKTKTTDQGNVLFLKAFKFFFIVSLLFTFTTNGLAQETPPGDGTGGGSEGGDPDTSTPFDGGISLLLTAGVAYGAKEWFNAKRQMNAQQSIEL